MKKISPAASILLMLISRSEVSAQYIPDSNFAAAIAIDCPTCIDSNQYLTADAQSLASLDIHSTIELDLTGLDGFANLQTFYLHLTYISTFPALPANLDTLLFKQDHFISGIPALPSTLRYFKCNYDHLTSLPALPGLLKYLDCSQNQLTALPTLPDSLEYLDCFVNQLSDLPTLPDSLVHLNCESNQLSDLPALPGSLEYLACGGNQLTNLQALPDSIHYLECAETYITTIPNLPWSCDTAYLYSNDLSGLPSLSPNMKLLDCSDNNLTELPDLPSSLIYLDCSKNSIFPTLPALPNSLTTLYAWENYLQYLPALSTGLKSLHCANNHLVWLPALPDSLTLTSLVCYNNQITVIPPLPPSLTGLSCSFNPIVHLPALGSLEYLSAVYCSLVDVPPFPASLQDIYLDGNNISSLPDLPPNLYHLGISYNPISCLPYMPASTGCIYIDGTNINCFPNIPPYMFDYCDYLPNLPLCDAGNLNGCLANPTIRGNVYGDFNNDSIFDAGEYHIPNVVVKATPGNFLGISDTAGNYSIAVPIATTDTAQAVSFSDYYITPAIFYTLTFDSTSGQISDGNDFGLLVIDSGANLDISLVSSHFIPGFNSNLYLTIRNVGTTSLDGLVTLTFDPAFTFVSADEGGTAASNVVTWNFISLNPFQSKLFTATVNCPSNVTAGTIVNDIASGTVNGATDIDLANNTQNISEAVIGSYDPNVKEVSDAALTTVDLANGKYLEYTIHFQNTGTAPATYINLIDTLSDKLDATTFGMIAASHYYEITLANDLTKANHPVFVKWLFNNILLPDSSTDFAGSQGFVKFRIRPKNDLLIGDQIQNTAGIYFDYNEPVITNAAITDIVIANAVANLNDDFFRVKAYPNPAENTTTIHFDHVTSSQLLFQVTDELGIVMMEKIISVPHESFDLKLDLRKFHNGVYVITVKSLNGVRVMKLVKD